MTKINSVYSHNFKSAGARRLAKALKVKRIKHQNSRFKGGPRKLVLNWGSTEVPTEVTKCNVLNSPIRVRFCTNKLRFFQVGSKHARLPAFADNSKDALKMLEKGDVVARRLLSGSGGRGIVIIKRPEDMVEAPLYTQYIKKMSEFRIHIFRGEIIDIQRKVRRKSTPDEKVDWAVRNLENGFVFMRHSIVCPSDVKEQALDAFNWTGLDFGAVDVVWNQKQRQAYVLEINTAPGLEGSTIDSYLDAMRSIT